MLKQLVSYTAYVVVSSLVVIGIFLYQQNKYSNADITAPIDKQQVYQCHITQIIDGDSVLTVCPTLSQQSLSVRLLYIDAPELSQSPWGEQSKQALQTILAQHHNQTNIIFSGKDIYHRYLAELFVGKNESVNQKMVALGRATVYLRYQPPTNYISTVQLAKQQKIGIWKEKGLQQNPQRYRRLTN